MLKLAMGKKYCEQNARTDSLGLKNNHINWSPSLEWKFIETISSLGLGDSMHSSYLFWNQFNFTTNPFYQEDYMGVESSNVGNSSSSLIQVP